jgi:Cu(I)/Ag(I) efflux system membrane fusion protein
MSTQRPLSLAALLVLALSIGAALGYWGNRHRTEARPDSGTAGSTNTSGASAGRPVLYWYDPMKPDQHFDKPGRSPYMDMALVPKYADAQETAGGVTIDPRIVQNLGIRTAVVKEGQLRAAIIATGIVRFNERHVAIVQARSAGFVERSYDHAVGDLVKAGAPLIDLLVPEWAGAQAEYLALRKGTDRGLTSAARTRLHLLGMPDGLVARLDATGEPQSVFTITAPAGGVIQSLNARQGMAVSIGMTIAEINGVDPMWVEADVPEALADAVTVGAQAEVTLAAYPGLRLAGRVITLLPAANDDSRTVRARIELPNPKGNLRDGLFAKVSLVSRSAEAAALVPSEAVIRTGTRTVVVVATDDGHFAPVEITTGQEAGGNIQVLKGLVVGQRVVVSGQFLIDSEASLSGALTRMEAPAPAAPKAPAESTP